MAAEDDNLIQDDRIASPFFFDELVLGVVNGTTLKDSRKRKT